MYPAQRDDLKRKEKQKKKKVKKNNKTRRVYLNVFDSLSTSIIMNTHHMLHCEINILLTEILMKRSIALWVT